MVVIKNGRVMDPKTGLDQVCDLRIEGKKIVEIAENQMCIRDSFYNLSWNSHLHQSVIDCTCLL